MDYANPANLLITGVYYVLTAALSFFAVFGVYVLIRYGKSRSLALTIAVVFCFLYLQILSQSHQALVAILNS
ncbi:MAG TPA: hypothetical protein VHA30_04575 [Patescibacteria group bacterium]|nr:hypothetical protein [Patescibacteria group bacterium]